ncbi:pentapeptide repeat-containing protein [Saccharopolyspora shandongensis]|uniref:pentapeptide repeat-containing protein n=1 Tax=Saccharopolyspora shandongensis TaxID=418495 RepID=UPI00341361BB
MIAIAGIAFAMIASLAVRNNIAKKYSILREQILLELADLERVASDVLGDQIGTARQVSFSHMRNALVQAKIWSESDVHAFDKALQVRNRVAHGDVESVDYEDLISSLATLRRLRDEISDKIEVKVTELSSTSVEQMGSDKAPVRLAGMYALEQVGQNSPNHRQFVINILCAYLRMPAPVPAEKSSTTDVSQPSGHTNGGQWTGRKPGFSPILAAAAGLSPDWTEQQEERQVRLAAQRLLTQHLRPNRDKYGNPTNPAFWPDVELDLTGATLHDWNFAHCEVASACFSSAYFDGEAWFHVAQFNGKTSFSGARFGGNTSFGDACFNGNVSFDSANFSGDTSFGEARFNGNVSFGSANFSGDSSFGSAYFNGHTTFDSTNFNGDSSFDSVHFNGHTIFNSTNFNGRTTFGDVLVRLDHGTSRSSAWPDGWTVRESPSANHAGRWGKLVQN